MAWRYGCRVCQTTTGWLPKGDAAAKRAEHRRDIHGGMTPVAEEFVSNAERLVGHPTAWRWWAALFTIGSVAWLMQRF